MKLKEENKLIGLIFLVKLVSEFHRMSHTITFKEKKERLKKGHELLMFQKKNSFFTLKWKLNYLFHGKSIFFIDLKWKIVTWKDTKKTQKQRVSRQNEKTRFSKWNKINQVACKVVEIFPPAIHIQLTRLIECDMHSNCNFFCKAMQCVSRFTSCVHCAVSWIFN